MAPSLEELGAKFESFEKQYATKFEALDTKFEAFKEHYATKAEAESMEKSTLRTLGLVVSLVGIVLAAAGTLGAVAWAKSAAEEKAKTAADVWFGRKLEEMNAEISKASDATAKCDLVTEGVVRLSRDLGLRFAVKDVGQLSIVVKKDQAHEMSPQNSIPVAPLERVLLTVRQTPGSYFVPMYRQSEQAVSVHELESNKVAEDTTITVDYLVLAPVPDTLLAKPQ